jgi:hypothetical protein
MVKRMQKAFIQARRDRGGTHFILLVEPMFVLVCLASLPGTPRRAVDAAGLVLVWFFFCNGSGNAIANRQRLTTTIAKGTCGMQRVL